jgi:hypothetical protein
MKSSATTVARYLASLPAERRRVLEAVRAVLRANLDSDYEECMQYGMIGYAVPHRVFPQGYHCDPAQPLMFAALAAQKNYMALYLMSVYGDPGEERWLRAGFARAGTKLDMGKSCIRFRKLEDLPLELIGEAAARVPAKAYVARYLQVLGARAGTAGGRKVPARKKAAKAAARKKSAGRG